MSGILAACATTSLPGSVPGPTGAPVVGEPPTAGVQPASRPFELDRDAFAFPNLVRAERPGLNDGFANYCLIMTRAASQFFRTARFEAAQPLVSGATYTRLTREVLATAPWDEPRPASARIVIPGYPDLRAFSRAQEAAIKAAFSSNIMSMLDWRTWRVGVAFSPTHQAALARELVTEVNAGRPVPLMVTNFPSEDLLNHSVLVYARRPVAASSSGIIEFLGYDPNDPGSPLGVFFDPGTRGFWIPPLTYSPPGRIRAFRLYTSFLF